MKTTINFGAVKKELNALKRKYKETGKRYLMQGAAAVFEAYPKLNSFSLDMYAPYFNDGDACVFSAHTDDPKMEYDGVLFDPDDYEEAATFTPEMEKAYKVIVRMLNVFDDEIYQTMFGDGWTVTFHRNGKTSKEACYHD